MNFITRILVGATALSTLLFNRSASAQTIQDSMLPTSTIPMTLRVNAAIDTTANGAGAVWTMTNQGSYTLWGSSFGPASGAYHADLYPSADQVFRFQPYLTSSIPHYYFDTGAGGLDQVAFAVDPAYDTAYASPKRLLNFPMDIGGTCSYTDLDEFDNPVNVTWTYVGHGTLAGTPVGDIPNVAKMRSSNGLLILWNTSPLHPLLMAGPSYYDFNVFMPSMTGLADSEHTLSARAYPDPSNGQFTISLDHAAVGSRLTIHNATGQLVQDIRPAQSDRIALDLSAEASGLYTVLITQGAQHTKLQVMVQH